MKRLTNLLLFSVALLALQAQPATVRAPFETALEQISHMLSGKTPLNYERAVYLTENAYLQNSLSEQQFTQALNYHTGNIRLLMEAHRTKTIDSFTNNWQGLAATQAADYESTLANYAIYTYLTDTTYFLQQGTLYAHLPYTYSHVDPLGTLKWQHTQVSNLLLNPQAQGNCYALASLFKIFSERLQSKADLCIAPGHIYIRHTDDKGTYYNIEPAGGAFPGNGTLAALTYSTPQAVSSGIALRPLNLPQSVALCLVYLAKGYQQLAQTRTAGFALQCAERALQYDPLNLNAMLLKAEVLEQTLLATGKPVGELRKDSEFQQYEKLLVRLFNLGYREMPREQKQLIIDKLRGEDVTTAAISKQTPAFTTRTATLSNGLLDEEMLPKATEQYHQTLFNTKAEKITAFVPETATNYPVDLVVFAWQVDPLAYKFTSLSPYNAFGNNPIVNIDPDGREIIYVGNRQKDFQSALLSLTKDSKIMMMFYMWMQNSPEKYYIGYETESTGGLLMYYKPSKLSFIESLFSGGYPYEHTIRYNSKHPYNKYDNPQLFEKSLSEEVIHAAQIHFSRFANATYSELQLEVEARVFRAYLGYFNSEVTYNTKGDTYKINEGAISDFVTNISVQNYFQAARNGDGNCMQEYEAGFRQAVGEIAKNITSPEYYGKDSWGEKNAGAYVPLADELPAYLSSGSTTPLFDAVTKKP